MAIPLSVVDSFSVLIIELKELHHILETAGQIFRKVKRVFRVNLHGASTVVSIGFAEYKLRLPDSYTLSKESGELHPWGKTPWFYARHYKLDQERKIKNAKDSW